MLIILFLSLAAVLDSLFYFLWLDNRGFCIDSLASIYASYLRILRDPEAISPYLFLDLPLAIRMSYLIPCLLHLLPETRCVMVFYSSLFQTAVLVIFFMYGIHTPSSFFIS